MAERPWWYWRNRLLIYSTATGRLARELPSLHGVIRDVAWSPDGTKLLVTLFYDPAAHLLQSKDGREASRLPVEREGAAVAFAPGGKLVAVSRGETGSALRRLAVAPGARLVASAGLDGTVRLHDVVSGALVEALAWHATAVWGLAWAGPVLVSGDGQGRLALWDVSDRLRGPRGEIKKRP